MINNTDKIIPGKSLGGININDPLDTVLEKIVQSGYSYQTFNFSADYTQFVLNSGEIKFVINNNSKLVANICCTKPYKGKSLGVYGPGISIKNLIDISEKQIILHGFIIVDGVFEMGYNLPNEFEELDEVHDLPANFVLEELYIMKENWWR